jgi:hypothetical protein
LLAPLKLHQRDSQHPLVPLARALDGTDLLLVMPPTDHSLATEPASHNNGPTEDALLPVLRDITSGLVEPHAAGTDPRARPIKIPDVDTSCSSSHQPPASAAKMFQLLDPAVTFHNPKRSQGASAPKLTLPAARRRDEVDRRAGPDAYGWQPTDR